MRKKTDNQQIKKLHTAIKCNHVEKVREILSKDPRFITGKHPTTRLTGVQLASDSKRDEEINILITKAEGDFLRS
jgi:hypothetical protein